MEYKGYIAAIHLDDRDNILVGKIAGIKDSVTFHATDVAGLREAFEEAVNDYLEQCAESGFSPDKSFSGNIAVRATPRLHRRLSGLAAARGLSINQFVVSALEEAAERATGSHTIITD